MVDPVTVPRFAAVVLIVAVIASGWGISYLGTHFLFDPTRDYAPGYITAAIPFFFSLMLLELLLTKLTALVSSGGRYDLADTWSSLSCGITQQLIVRIIRDPLRLGIIPYTLVWQKWGFKNVIGQINNPFIYLLTLIVVDFLYYWFHRWAHEFSVLWAGHSVHHSSDHYNLSTALRQSWWQGTVSWVFYLPAALACPPAVMFTVEQANTLYQFWVHTCCIRRLGIFENLLMTPSHHRVHHDRRVHKNFGGMLIIWDKMFGTFQPELGNGEPKVGISDELCVFGTYRPITSWTEPVLQYHGWREIIISVRASKRLLWPLIAGPGWSSTRASRRIVAAPSSIPRQRLQTQPSLFLSGYISTHFVLTLVGTVLLFLLRGLPLRVCTGLTVALLMSLLGQGLLFDGKPYGRLLEGARCLFMAVYGGAWCIHKVCPSQADPWVPWALGLLFALSAVICFACPSWIRSHSALKLRAATE
eukprot:TRINITY_DN11412_c0_g1_i1.p1 TRINITY_DN11412_c0_g1~~TRINITY_DN11412_c0_g1_i1.p1  ORF type:complete len:480 (-),score=28.55 TRINITY_DN11412_c0_g1_i1:6-1424(-)